MISVTLPTGESAWLSLYAPEMSGSVTFRVKSSLYTDRGATGREARRSSDPTVNLSMDWQAELAGADVTAMRAALVAYQNEPIVMPCWPLAVAGSAYLYGTTPQGGYMIAWNDSGAYQFFAGVVSSPGSWDWVAPAIYGYFEGTPKAIAAQGDFVRYSFAFVEDSPATWALGPFPASASADGPAIGSFTPPGFPFELDWAKSPETGSASINVNREEVGPGRRTIQTFYPNLPERVVRGQMTGSDLWPLMCWWASQDGGVQSQWVSTWLSAGLLSADAASGATAITLANQSGVATDTVLAFTVTSPNGTTSLFFRKVASVVGATVNLTAALPVQCYTNLTTVCLAMLGRHLSDTLEVMWTAPGVFTAKLDWVELRQETAIASGETLGVTLGRKSSRPYLLEISSVQPVAEVLWRITDWSTGITLGDGRVFAFEPLEVGERKRNVDLSDQALKITLPWDTGSPLANFIPGQSFRRVFARLYYVPVAADGTVGSPVQDWYGEIFDCKHAGPKMFIQVGGPFRVFERQIPSDQFGTTCNAHLFDTRCGVSKAAWTVSAVVVSTSGSSLVFNTATRPGGAMTPLQSDGAFAGGSLQWVSGGVTKLVGIYGSTYSGGNYTLTLREPTTIPAGTALTILPSCDQQWLGGCARYSGKFRGFPFIPARAPQFQLPTQTSSGGKK
jgi:hypothetical protein